MSTQRLNSDCSLGEVAGSKLEERARNLNRLGLAFLLAIGFIGVELIGSFLSGSLALFADAIHMIGDATALGFALLAGFLSMQPATHQRSFGFYRLEVIAALFNAVILIGMAIFIANEAFTRWDEGIEIKAGPMLSIAIAGLFINLFMLKILHSKKSKNINLKAAFFHVLGDTLSSVAVIAGAISIYFWSFYIADLLASFFVSTIIAIMGAQLFFESLRILIEAAPPSIDFHNLQSEILNSSKEIKEVNDLHIWEISSKILSMTCSLELQVNKIDEAENILSSVKERLRKKFGIYHATIETTFHGEPSARSSLEYQPSPHPDSSH